MAWDLSRRQSSPTALLFCLALDPLGNLINEGAHRYTLTTKKITSKETRKVTHLLHMDDLKLFALNDGKLSEQLKFVKQYSDNRFLAITGRKKKK